jgi:AsmA family protein
MPDTSPPQTSLEAPPRQRRRHFGLITLAVLAVVIILLILLWNWDWFLPLVDARASAALGRRVTADHLHVRLGRTTTVVLDDVTVANPPNFPQTKPFGHIDHLTVAANVMDYIHTGGIVLPIIALDHPDFAATALPDGRNNFTISGTPQGKPVKPSPPPQIGDLRITDGVAHVVDPKFRSDFTLTVATREASTQERAAIVVNARGTYAGQPITGRFIGGALLNLRDAAHPYPIDLVLENGPTHVAMDGTVRNPMNFAGANVRLKITGPDLHELFPLTGIPLPHTPPYSLAGNVDYVRLNIRMTNIVGRVGSSDLNGDIAENPGLSGKPDVKMNLWSHRVDLADLGGFIGAPPGKATTPGETPQQKAVIAANNKKTTLFPDTPINLPQLRAADVHLTYRGDHIENKYTPFDDIETKLDIVNGRVDLHPLNFGIGTGRIASNIELTPGAHDVMATRADMRFQHIDLSRVLQATHTFKGEGILGGEARIDSHGNSMAAIMGQGNGELKLILLGGGNLSALLVDLTGLEFGNGILSALGVPNRATLQCFVTDLPLNQGTLSTKVFLVDTTEGRITGQGTSNFTNQTIDFSLTTRSKQFSIGSLPGPINVTGPLGSPSIRPGAEVVARAGAAAGLGVLLTPLGALLPTIQFGVGNDNACTQATVEERAPLRVPKATRRAHT